MTSHFKRYVGVSVLGAMLLVTSAAADIIAAGYTTAVSTDASSTELSLAKPAGLAEGDLMIAAVVVKGGTEADITPPSGWTFIDRVDNDLSVTLASYWKKATTSEPSSYTWTIDDQTTAAGGITRYTGVSATPIAAVASSTGRGSTATSSSVTTTRSGAQILALFGHEVGTSGTSFFSTTTGMTKVYDVKNEPFGPTAAVEHLTQILPGVAGPYAASLGSVRDWVAQTIALRKDTNLNTGLVSYWKLDDATDSVGSNNLTNYNSAGFASGKLGNALDLDASSSQYLAISDASQSGLDLTSAMTISAWVKFDSLPSSTNYMYFVSKWQDGTNAGASYFLSLFNNSGSSKLYTTLRYPDVWEDIQRDWSPSTGVWYHVAVTWSASTNTAKMYVNGSQIGSDYTSSIPMIQDNSIRFKIGANDNSSGTPYQFHDGMIDEVGVWSRALTSSEILELYNSGYANSYPF